MPDNTPTLKLNDFLPFRLVNVSEQVSLNFAERYRRKYRMTRPEWRAFAILGEAGELTATEVGKISHMHKTKVSRAIASLEERGWLSRKRDAADGRLEHLTLTKRGRSHYAKLAKEANEFSNDIEKRLGADAMQTVWRAIHYLDELKR